MNTKAFAKVKDDLRDRLCFSKSLNIRSGFDFAQVSKKF